MAELTEYLERAVADKASDLFIVAGSAVSEKAEGDIRPISEGKKLPPDTEQLICAIYALAERSMEHYRATGDGDFSFAVRGLARFRVNAYRQRGSMAAVVRVVAFEIPDWRALGIPEAVMDAAGLSHGMVPVTGTAGSGKSITLACIIARINRTRKAHIITLEDPIELLHCDRMSIVSQREIAIDTADYLSALRACLRQAPDVILLGEMRDYETIRTAMTAAETGHPQSDSREQVSPDRQRHHGGGERRHDEHGSVHSGAVQGGTHHAGNRARLCRPPGCSGAQTAPVTA